MRVSKNIIQIMKIEQQYDWVVLDTNLFFPPSGTPDESDDVAFLELLAKLKSKHPDSKHIAVFDGADHKREWRDRQSEVALANGWISFFEEGEMTSRRIHALTSLATNDGIDILVYAGNVEDLKLLTARAHFCTVDEDGDLERHWTEERFLEVCGFEPGQYGLVQALSGWGNFRPLVEKHRLWLVVDSFRKGRRLVYNGVDFSDEIEKRLKLLDAPEPTPEEMSSLRSLLCGMVKRLETRLDG